MDELFSYDERRTYEFCERMSKLLARVPWEVKWLCQMKVAGLKPELLDAMRDAGCFMVSYGFESFSPTVLRSMRKGITPQQIENAIKHSLDRGISIQGNFIFGDKAETLETAKETLDFWKKHPEAGLLLYFIVVCPNSELYQYCVNNGFIKNKLDHIRYYLFDPINITSLSHRDFMTLRAMVDGHTIKYRPAATDVVLTEDRVTARCPHCKTVVTYNNYDIQLQRRITKAFYCRHCRRRFFVERDTAFKKILRRIKTQPFIYRYFYGFKGVLKSLKKWKNQQKECGLT